MSAIDRLLDGAVDLHFHSHPSPFPRAMDAAAAAERYEAARFRAVIMKSHHHSTVMEILALERLALSKLRLQVFGGIALNGAVGGLNPRAPARCCLAVAAPDGSRRARWGSYGRPTAIACRVQGGSSADGTVPGPQTSCRRERGGLDGQRG